ncbi:hypothetical protein FTW19_01330 [Terriglobus albidus]|uniref:Uncharacterized protein n=1 Tax=Terriglobus albidus TaxID=1592106 RepID=A0A5B9E352_9BACT|nr:hypothetical protein [Terriglobus albidus]QEE26762.1 hypothetical protein FTW19_01330 [Terriglobus albidus]
MLRSTLDRIIPALLIMLALSPLYLAFYFMHMYQRHGMPTNAVITVGSPYLIPTLAYLSSAYLYWRLPNARTIFQVLGVLYGALYALPLWRLKDSLSSWSVLHGNILAVGAWETAGVVLLGLLCAVQMLTQIRRPAQAN